MRVDKSFSMVRFAVLAVLTLSSASRTGAVTITAFDPLAGSPGDPAFVQIYGTGFANPVVVKYNGTQDTGASATTPTLIQSRVPVGATTGPISVQVGGSTTFSVTNFVIIGPGPYIGIFAPTSGSDNTVVTISGAHFGSPYATVTNVSFNGKPGTAINIQSTSLLQVNAPVGMTTGLISVKSSAGGFTNSSYFYAAPVITNVAPAAGRAGTNVFIRGLNFIGASAVTFGGVNASFIVNSNNQITATVPNDATTGLISVTAPAGAYYTSSNFIVQPTLTGFSPGAGNAGTNVTLNGFNLYGVTAVSFNGNAASQITNLSFSQATAVVPFNTTTGPITVTTTNGSVTSVTNFFMPPSISGFTPNSSAPGTTIRITGQNFVGATAVLFNGATAAGFTVTNNMNIGAVVPNGVITGPITVTTPGGTTNSTGVFYGAPLIFNFNPTHGLPGTNVTITGTNFLGATAVRFNGSNAASFTVQNNGAITTVVRTNATTGPISVVGPAGTNTSASNFVLDYTSDLAVTVVSAPNPVIVTSNLLYTIVVTNKGPFAAANVVLVNTLPINSILLSATNSTGTLNTNGNPVLGTLGSLALGGSATIALTIAAPTAGTITNIASVSSDYTDPVLTNNTTTNLTTVLPQPQLTIRLVPVNQVRLSWSVALTNFNLQFNTNPAATVTWSNVAATPSITNEQRSVTEPIAGKVKFYRLKQ